MRSTCFPVFRRESPALYNIEQSRELVLGHDIFAMEKKLTQKQGLLSVVHVVVPLPGRTVN